MIRSTCRNRNAKVDSRCERRFNATHASSAGPDAGLFKVSPLSDTTNLAPAMVGVDLFTHIRHMLSTTAVAYQTATLGVSTWLYAPFAFFCWLSPLVTIIFGFTRITIRPLQEPAGDEAEVAGTAAS